MSTPQDLSYTSEHEWLRIDGAEATVGITAYAADALGDIVYVELPEAGTKLTVGEACGELESTKSVSDLFAPANGEVLESNPNLADDPSLVNSDPYDKGWLFRVRIDGTPDFLDADAYTALTEEK